MQRPWNLFREITTDAIHGWIKLGSLFFFGIAMGLLEAICVVYLRQLINPVLYDPSVIAVALEKWSIELVREACTLIMLLTVAWLAGFNLKSRLSAFFFMFGVWDIVYYAGLKLFLDWPASILEWDCLFLIPVPWYSPVLAPILISVYFIFACCLIFITEYSKLNRRFSVPFLALQLPGFVLWYWSFVKDSSRIMTQGYEGIEYSWVIFICGMLCCVLGLWLARRLRDVSFFNRQ